MQQYAELERRMTRICGFILFTLAAYSPLRISGSLQAFALAPAGRVRSSPRAGRKPVLPRGPPLDLSPRGPSTAGAIAGPRCRRPAAGPTFRTACSAPRRRRTAARSMDGMDALLAQGASQGRDRLHSAVSYKRLSSGRFRFWPSKAGSMATTLLAHELQVLLSAGDPKGTRAAPQWRPVTVAAAGS
jgi:hypothetical protein